MNQKTLKLTTIATMLLSPYAYAAETTTDLGEIEVVATKENTTSSTMIQDNQDEGLLDQPSEGNSLPTTIAEPIPGQSTAQLLQDLPDINITNGPRQISESITIRGLSDEQIIVAIDGVDNPFGSFAHNQLRSLPNAFLFKQVEVSTPGSNILYGSGNIGGSVNFTTIDPEDILKGRDVGAKLMAGGYTGAWGYQSGLAAAAKSGPVSFLFDIVGSDSNDIRTGGGDILADSAENDLQYLAKAVWDINSDQQLSLSYLNMYSGGQFPATTSKDVSATNPATDFDLRQQQLTLDYDLNPTDNPYINTDLKLFYLQTDQQTTPLSYAETKPWALPQDIHLDNLGAKLHNTSIFQSPLGQHSLLYGFNYNHITGEDEQSSDTNLNLPTGRQNQYAGIIQDTWQIFDDFALIFGGRYDSYYSNSGEINNHDSYFSKQLTFNYKAFTGVEFFGGYSESFRAPTISELYLTGSHPGTVPVFFLPNPDLKPEIGHNTELGVETIHNMPNEQQIRFRGSVYYNRITDYILSVYDSGFFPQMNRNENISDAELYGFTLAASYRQVWFDVKTNFTYTRGKTLSSYQETLTETVEAGANLPIPQAKGHISIGVPVDDIDSRITTNIDYALQQNHTLPDQSPVPGYILLGFAYQWQPQATLNGLSIDIGVENIFDQKYVIYDGEYSLPAMGRNFYLQLAYDV